MLDLPGFLWLSHIWVRCGSTCQDSGNGGGRRFAHKIFANLRTLWTFIEPCESLWTFPFLLLGFCDFVCLDPADIWQTPASSRSIHLDSSGEGTPWLFSGPFSNPPAVHLLECWASRKSGIQSRLLLQTGTANEWNATTCWKVEHYPFSIINAAVATHNSNCRWDARSKNNEQCVCSLKWQDGMLKNGQLLSYRQPFWRSPAQ